MKNTLKIFNIIVLSIFIQSCINQKVTEDVVFNPIKEYQLSTNFVFTRYFIENSDSTKLESWYMTEPNAQFNLVYFSGNGSNIRSAIHFFNELESQLDLNIFSVNYSGYGLSEGTPTIQGIVNDGRIAFDYFENEIGDKKLPTVILGYSLGGYVALNLVDNKDIDKIILMSTFSSLEELKDYLIKEALPGVIRPFLSLEVDPVIYKLDNLKLIKKVNQPILFIHGDADNFIPASMSKKLFDLSNSISKKFVKIKDADHRMVLKDKDKNRLVVYEIKDFMYNDFSINHVQ